MTAHHCTMCLATKIPLVCMLFCVPSWISGSSGVVAQVNNETTQYTTLSTSHVGVKGLDPTAGGLHIHDHNGFQIKETSLHDVAREEGKYFVSLLFTKYGNQNETLHRSNLLELFHNLGFSGQNDEHIHASETKDKSVHNENHKRDFHETKSLSKTLHVHDDIGSHVHDDIGSHVHDDIGSHLHDHVHDDINSHNHISDNKKSNSLHFQEQAKQFTPSQSNISHPDVHLGKSSLGNNDKLESSKRNSELRHDAGQKYEHASDSISSHSNTNISIHEQNYNNKQNVKQNSSSQFSERDSENVDLKMNVAGGKKHMGKSGRRAKKGRKQKTKKQESESLLSRTERDVSKQSVLHYHGDHTKCLTIKEILEAFDLENKDEITLTDFLYMSPAIIHQLDAQNCTHKALGTIHDDHDDLHIGSDSGAISKSINSIPSKVWGYSFAAVLIISLVGLLGVAVIPIMQKVFYNHLLQFLVALAVGALMGDALLHLLPHAIGASQMSHNHASPEQSHVSHTGTIWKGLCGLMGIFFFFLMERVLTIITEVKRKKKTKHRLKQSPHHSLCKLDFGKAVGSKLSSHTEPDYQSCEEMVMVVHPNKSLKSYADETHDGLLHSIRECDVDHGKGDEFKALEDETMMTDVQHTHSHHGHSHFDGPMPKSVASIAWMVILGDGIHNFSDGLAIGAAFANSVTGGFSTSIAVFCHELPHEIGDFAVLLRAGMSAKQAIVYNCVSSILCFVGMTIGVALGNIDDVTLWIFACVGGIFIYIALVDMLPEMTSVETKQGENPFCHLLLQCSGMLAGSSIMLLIAIFEDDLLTALD